MTGTRARFVATICAGSFLLFLVQPMIARMALPRLGGAPSVWNSAMLVYQALLLGGYAYAHWLGRLSVRRQAMIHLGLFLLAAAFLPIGLMRDDPPATIDPALWILWLLAGSIGPLFFMVAAQAPLMQRWFTAAGAGDPYPLYAASNLGSFAGLIAYPLLVEPLMPLRAQSLLWSVGYGLLFWLVYACARLLPPVTSDAEAEASADQPVTPTPSGRQMLRWIAIAAIPSGLMLSTSLHLTTDIVAMPLLWVMPLGLYLLSFSVAFAAGRSLAEAMTVIAPLLLMIGACTAFIDSTGFPILVAASTLLVLFVVATALHARLYDLRPAPEHLTRFYLALSIGGMLGGLFCALAAPLLFNWTYEHPILLGLAALLMTRGPLFPWVERLWASADRRTWLTAAMLVAGLILSLIGEGVLLPEMKSDAVKAVCFTLIILMGVVAVGRRVAFAGCVVYLMLCLGGWGKLALSVTPGALTRSYFGVYMVRDNGPDQRLLVHGTTVHGIQNRRQGREADPTSYYAPESGVGMAMRAAPALFGPRARIGVVGLGSGTLACYARPGERWRFYEIDPAMVGIARNPADFTFLSRCLPDAAIALGDARLVLAREPAGSADLLVIDAFSSDAIPMHLLTREAMAVYARHLSPGGLLMVHISNRYLDLEPVIAAAARAGGWDARMRYYKPDRRDADRNYSASVWVALSRDPARLDRLVEISGRDKWQDPDHRPGFSAWTDDHASILPILKF
ncbi:MAG: fused MFS/spermidine synthase [Sphingobium sp.]|nr:fused MFS/spermidine synthase [Sphingobium sp.]